MWFIEYKNRLNKLIVHNSISSDFSTLHWPIPQYNNLIFIPFHPFFFLCLQAGASLAAQSLFIFFSNSPILSTCDTFKYMVIALKEESSSAKKHFEKNDERPSRSKSKWGFHKAFLSFFSLLLLQSDKRRIKNDLKFIISQVEETSLSTKNKNKTSY